MDTIGKCPDLLVFKKEDFDLELGYDISHIPHRQIDDYVRKAIAGIEVRSSAFLIDRYEEAMQRRTQNFISMAIEIKEKILSEYSDLLSQPSRHTYIDMVL